LKIDFVTLINHIRKGRKIFAVNISFCKSLWHVYFKVFYLESDFISKKSNRFMVFYQSKFLFLYRNSSPRSQRQRRRFDADNSGWYFLLGSRPSISAQLDFKVQSHCCWGPEKTFTPRMSQCFTSRRSFEKVISKSVFKKLFISRITKNSKYFTRKIN